MVWNVRREKERLNQFHVTTAPALQIYATTLQLPQA